MRGNAIRRVPIISGTSQLANGPRMTEVIIPIIIAPCMPTSVRYWLAPNTCVFGLQQLGADQHRVEAADEEEHADPDDVLDRRRPCGRCTAGSSARSPRPRPRARRASAGGRASAGSGSWRSRGRRGSRSLRTGSRAGSRCRSDRPRRSSSRGSARGSRCRSRSPISHPTIPSTIPVRRLKPISRRQAGRLAGGHCDRAHPPLLCGSGKYCLEYGGSDLLHRRVLQPLLRDPGRELALGDDAAGRDM